MLILGKLFVTCQSHTFWTFMSVVVNVRDWTKFFKMAAVAMLDFLLAAMVAGDADGSANLYDDWWLADMVTSNADGSANGWLAGTVTGDDMVWQLVC